MELEYCVDLVEELGTQVVGKFSVDGAILISREDAIEIGAHQAIAGCQLSLLVAKDTG